ncbi:HPr family phosphocarrier protein [Ruania halotolerans]|uniref:HPr family phosphocarrier protein n=1 Tax=Ruania halotolerans TaxID=2897773 RepID=UPI001E5109F6|nr:HPr family phosphocarrier protein [Ruania halotolerans]UFU06682.1 HPr family phosphocarrier protein [Ruania halotolerans]
MATRTATIASPVGLHARPAAVFTRAVEDSGVAVRISKDGSVPQDAASILGVMTLGARHGDTVTLHADGPGSEEALDQLADLLSHDLTE